MRRDENGNECPETLGEYRDLCNAIGGADCEAVAVIDKWIEAAPNGRAEIVLSADSQLRAVLMPLLIRKAGRK